MSRAGGKKNKGDGFFKKRKRNKKEKDCLTHQWTIDKKNIMEQFGEKKDEYLENDHSAHLC